MVSAHFYLFLIGGRVLFGVFSGWINWPTMLQDMCSEDRIVLSHALFCVMTQSVKG